jgi:outer membrane receptor protein involved in Fe transport
MKTFKRARITQLSMALAIALSASPLMAQNTSSAISGEVVGANSQPLAGATVTIKHLESGSISTATTDASGRYSARGLRVGGPYTITITKDGQSQTRENVFLQLAETKYVDVTLGGQQVLDTVTVTGVALGSEIFSADKMGTGTNISRDQIDAYPSINRNIQDFARLDPRVVQTDKARNEISVSGQNPRYNAIRVDGVSISDTFGLESNNLPSPRQPLSMDLIEAIKVDVASYDVTVTGGTGAVITAVTKSGTNELSGSVYGLYRENGWSGEGESGVRPDLFDTQTTYGFTVGGPILKDTLFFFANYEKYTGTDEFTGNSGFGPIGSGATNIVNVTQAQIDEIIDISQNTWGFDPGDLTLPSLDTETEEYGVKIDWNINENHRADFRYSKSEQSTPFLVGASNTSLSLSNYNYVRDFNLDTYTAQLFSDWSDNFTTEAKISYRDYSAVRSALSDLPAISIQIGSNFVNLGTEENTHTNVLETQTWNGFFAATYFLGDHAIKFGADYEDNSVYNLFGRRTNGVYRFANIAAYEAGTPNRFQYFRPAGDDIDNMAADFGIGDFGLFAMDTWAVNSNLTVNYGFRYDMYSVDESPTYNATASNTFGYDNSNTIDGESLFQPRVGFNYTFDSERPSQLRGGVGLFSGQSPTVWLANPYSNNGIAYTDYFISTGAGVTFVPDPDDQLSAFTPGNGATPALHATPS